MKISKTKRPYSETKLNNLLWQLGYYVESIKDEYGNKWRVRNTIRYTDAFNCRDLREVQSVLIALKDQSDFRKEKVRSFILHDGYEWICEVD